VAPAASVVSPRSGFRAAQVRLLIELIELSLLIVVHDLADLSVGLAATGPHMSRRTLLYCST
jgi:uncharacterized protein YjfI (DUF2170 family)